jgi:hypothetical protein
MQSIDGKMHDIAALSQERPLLIYVWATGAAFAVTRRLRLISWQKRGNVVSIAMRSGDNAKLARWVEKKQLKMPVINDENGALSQAWQVSVTPTLVIVSKGNVVSTTTGWTSYWGLKSGCGGQAYKNNPSPGGRGFVLLPELPARCAQPETAGF